MTDSYFPVEFVLKSNSIKQKKDIKTYQGISLNTTLNELNRLLEKDGYSVEELIIENEYSFKDLTKTIPLFEILKLNQDSIDIPTILAVTAIMKDNDNVEESYFSENKNEKNIIGHSYDKIEDSNIYVDQLVTSSVIYKIEGIDKNGVQKKVELSSQQCIIVDNDPRYDPYILLSNSGRKALDNLQPLDLVVALVDSTISGNNEATNLTQVQNQTQNQNQNRNQIPIPIPIETVGVENQQRQPAFSFRAFLLRSVRHFLTQGTIKRFLSLGITLAKYFILMIIIGLQYRFNNQTLENILISLFLLFIFTRDTVLNKMEAIVQEDFNEGLQAIPLYIITKLRRCSKKMSDGFNFGALRMVQFGIGNNRPNLTVEDEEVTEEVTEDQDQFIEGTDSDQLIKEKSVKQEEKQKQSKKKLKIIRQIKIFVQDIVLLFITIIPECFLTYSTELMRQEGLVFEQKRKREEQEQEQEQTRVGN